jgi:hypothetical protein
MASNFVPLQPAAMVPAKPEAAPTALKPAAPPPANTGFSPFNGPASCSAGGAQPVITLKKEGDRITQIRVQCVCGQIIELACDY